MNLLHLFILDKHDFVLKNKNGVFTLKKHLIREQDGILDNFFVERTKEHCFKNAT